MNVYQDICSFYQSYQGKKEIYGYSCEGRELFAFFVGEETAPVSISQYAIHAREWICSYLALEHIARGIKRGGVWVIPLANPDGALLCQEGLKSVKKQWRRDLLYNVNGGNDFSLWKANAETVDLNVNFSARWGTGKSNVKTPSSQNYIGAKPFCASESLALKNFTYRVKPNYTLSWHCKGEQIYYQFHQPFLRKMRDQRLAKILRKSTGYPLVNTLHSAGGYKDWCVETLKIPSFTVEVGNDELSHPLKKEDLEEIVNKCKNALWDISAGF